MEESKALIVFLLFWMLLGLAYEAISEFINVLFKKRVKANIINVKIEKGESILTVEYLSGTDGIKTVARLSTLTNALIFSLNESLTIYIDKNKIIARGLKLRIWNLLGVGTTLYFLAIGILLMAKYFKIEIELQLINYVFAGFLLLGLASMIVILYEKACRANKIYSVMGTIIGFESTTDDDNYNNDYPVIEYYVQGSNEKNLFVSSTSKSSNDRINKKIRIYCSKEFLIAESGDFITQWFKFLLFSSVFILSLIAFFIRI